MKKCKKFSFRLINIANLRLKYRFFAFFLLFLLAIFLYIKYLGTPIVVANTRTQIGNYATRSINYAIADTMNQNVSYGDLISVIKNESGDVAYIEANSVRINLLSKTMSKVVMSNFLEFAKNPIKISLGSFSGISILTGVGPKVAFHVNPYGEVHCYFTSAFESAGINQTYHKIYLVISITVNIVFPFEKVQVTSSSEVLLCETLIVGQIPEVYLNSNMLMDMLNLVPSKFAA